MFQISEVLKKVPFFRTLSKDGISFIVERLKFKPYEANEVICRTGDPGDRMYIIINGSVDVLIESPETGQKKVIATLGSGDYFGEMALLTGEPRSATVVTREPSEMFILSKDDFDVIVERFPSISLSMGKIMSQRLRDTLQKAAQSGEKAPTALRGNLAQKSLEDIIKLCEANSLNGTVLVTHGEESGEIEFEKGVIQQVRLGSYSEAEAMDRMLGWQEGEFVIKPRPLTIEEAEPVVEEEPADGPRRVVIINHSKVVQKVLEQAFEQNGFEVYSVETASKGKNLVQSLKPHLLVVDSKLPDASGLEFVRQLRAFADTPVIILAADSLQQNLAEQSKQLGKVHLTSQASPQELVQLAREVLA